MTENAEARDLDLYEEESRCPYCGEYMSYCQGHGEIGDPDGFIALQKHDDDNHEDCHPNGCEVLRERQWNYMPTQSEKRVEQADIVAIMVIADKPNIEHHTMVMFAGDQEIYCSCGRDSEQQPR